MYSFAENIFIILALKILSIYFNMGLVLILASDNFLINHIVTLCSQCDCMPNILPDLHF